MDETDNAIEAHKDNARGLSTSKSSTDAVKSELAAFVGSETRPEKMSMSQHSPKRAMRQRPSTDTAAKALDRLIREFRDKLDGKPVTIRPPAGDEFKRHGQHEVWGMLARQAGKCPDAAETRAAIENVLTDYQAETTAEVWERLDDSEPVVIPIEAAGEDDLMPYQTGGRAPDSDLARGLALLPHFVGRVRWVQEWKELGWLFWNGRHWERNAAAVERLAKKILPREIAAKYGDYDAAAEASKKVNVINAVWWIRSDPRILTKPEELDAERWLLNLDNGTLDLRTMELRPHDPADLCTKISPTAYDPAAECPLFLATLEKFLPDADVRTFLLRHFGSALTGVITHLKLPILYGLGRNGKSTITNALAFVLGPEYCVTLDAEVLTDDGSKRKTSDRLYHIASLHGMRFVIVNELEENCILRGPQLKALVSTDKLTGRRPYEMPFSFWPSHKIVMLTNHKPRLRSTDEGTMRRLALVPFDVQIQPSEDDKAFGEKLKAEAAGILNLLIEGCKDWQNQGQDAPVPQVVAAATESYRHEEDIIGRFVETCIKRIPGGFVTGKAVYEEFKKFCDESGIEPMSGTAFGRKIGAIFDKSKTQKGWKYDGIIINPDWNSEVSQAEV
jgi:putative DNA primase/helicase